MRFDILTIFPQIFDSYFNESMIKRAKAKKLVDIKIHNLRDFTDDKSRSHGDRGSSTVWSGHKKVDDRPFGGGPGMVLKIEPLVRAISSILRNPKSEIRNPKQIPNPKSPKNKIKIILFSTTGKQFNSKMAADWAKKYGQIIMIAGHYEGVDERIFEVLKAKSYKLEAISVGPYVLTGGELPAMIVIDAVSRHIPGFLGKAESLEEKRHGIGVPVYTRPEVFVRPASWRVSDKKKKYRVPKVLLSGDHKKIAAWREARQRASPNKVGREDWRKKHQRLPKNRPSGTV